MISCYEFLNVVQQGQMMRQSAQEGASSGTYPALLDRVRTVIAEKHADDLSAVLGDATAEQTLRTLILKYTVDFMRGAIFDSEQLVERIYQDMAGFGILTAYLRDPAVEEININTPSQVEIVYGKGTKFLLDIDTAFPSAQAAVDIVRRLVRIGGKLLDTQTPHIDSYIGNGTRISAQIPPAIPPEEVLIASIRKQTKSTMTTEEYIAGGAASADMLEFLTMLLCNHVSVGIVGATGSGKSTLQSLLLNQYLLHNQDDNNRVYLIEDSRELNLIAYDQAHNRPTRVIYTTTKEAPNAITMADQTKSSLRFHPQLIVPAEVRDGAAWEAVGAGQTGHTILTSFHASDVVSAYNRLVTMCMMGNVSLPADKILEACVEAWPIMIMQNKQADDTRKLMQIYEATGVENGKVVGSMLFEFQTEQFQRDATGKVIRVYGIHKQVGVISKRLQQHLFARGVQQEQLEKFTRLEEKCP